MKILVNDIAASEGGALSILQDFYSYIKDNDTKNQWIFLLSNPYIHETQRIKVKVVKKAKASWKNRFFFDLYVWKRVVNEYRPDVILSLQNTIFFFCDYPQVAYIHQSIPFQQIKKFSLFNNEERKFWVYQNIIGMFIKYSARYANKVIVQTNWMKSQVERYSKKNQTYKIPPNLNPYNFSKEGNWKCNKFIYPTSQAIYKNNECLYTACDLLVERKLQFAMEVTLESNENRENVKFIGKIPRDILMEKYRQYTLVFPSYIETYGLPLAEGRMCGTLILAADTEFAREVLAGYANAYYFDPFNPIELAALMNKVITGEITKKQVSEKTSVRNTWAEMIAIVEGTGNNEK